MRRLIIVLAAAALLLAGACAVLWQLEAGLLPPRKEPEPVATDGAARGADEPDEAHPLVPLPKLPRWEGVPGDMPLMAGAQRLLTDEKRQRLATGGELIEQIGVYRIAGAALGEVAGFYERAAQDAGFEPTTRSDQPEPRSGGSWSQVFGRGGDTLLVRARATDANIRLTLIFRYTKTPGP